MPKHKIFYFIVFLFLYVNVLFLLFSIQIFFTLLTLLSSQTRSSLPSTVAPSFSHFRRPSSPARVSRRSPELGCSNLAQKRRKTLSIYSQRSMNRTSFLAWMSLFWPLHRNFTIPSAQLYHTTTSVGSMEICTALYPYWRIWRIWRINLEHDGNENIQFIFES